MIDITLSKLKKMLAQKNDQKSISETTFDILFVKAQEDKTFSDFKEILAIIKLVSKKEASGESYYRKLIKVLSIYEEKINAMISSEGSEFEGRVVALERFFSIFHKDNKIKAMGSSLTLNPFSQKRKAIKVISRIEKKYKDFLQKEKEIKAQLSQTALVSLLNNILAGKIMDSGLSSENKVNEPTSLLPEGEYPVIPGIQEDPKIIGYNRTMSFNDPNEKRSLHESFATERLKADFLDKFPWGANMETIDKLENALLNHINTTLNLVGSKHPLSASVQLSLTQYVLLSLDALGKLAAYTGAKVLENFDRIYSITTKLSETTKLLQGNNDPDFEKKISEKIAQEVRALAALNRRLPESNPVMNGFCHINEQLVHLLLKITYERSILTPSQPYSPYREEIDKVLALKKKQTAHKGRGTRGTQSKG